MPQQNNRDLLKYAGLGSQMIAALGIGVFIGLKLDRWLHTLPLFASLLPLLTLAAIFYKLLRDTNKDNKK